MLSALNEVDLHNQLQTAGLELVQCTCISKRKSKVNFVLNKIKIRDLTQFFINMEQMQSAGVPMLDALADIRDGSDNDQMRDVISEVHRDVRDGASLSESLAKHPNIFKPLYISMIKAGEETGDLTVSYLRLVAYLKKAAEIQAKIKKATRYPMIAGVVVVGTIIFMMSAVVPQVVGFLKYLELELPWYSTSLIATSNFFVQPQFSIFGISIYGAYIVVLVPTLIIIAFIVARRLSDDIAFKIDSFYLVTPLFGNIIRKINIARYAQTFSALFSSGIDVIRALKSSRETVTNLVLLDAMEGVEHYVQSGSPLSDALNASGEFPSMVVRMVRIGEESGGLSTVLDQVAEFYIKDVDEAIEALTEMIQPILTMVLALVIVWIAAGSLGPIYMNLGNMVDF